VKLKALSWPGLGVAVASAASMVAGNASLRFTSVADSLSIYATLSFVTAGLAWLFIGERPARRTMIASAVAVAGVGVILLDAEWNGSLLGKALAAIMTLGMAIMTVIIRRRRDLPMVPAVGLSAWLCSAACLPFAEPASIAMSDFWLCGAYGVFQSATGLVFYTIGSQRVPSAEATLLAALEVPLTPLWVWIAFSETPSTTTLIGGAIVLAAMISDMVLEIRRLRRESAGNQPFAEPSAEPGFS
jgi:drug/metabolite transporter (DMT)-like permease